MFNDSQILDDLLDQCAEQVTDVHGLDLFSMYCLHTGQSIGTLNRAVFITALIDEGAMDDSEDGSVLDIETLADSLFVRCIASMRPSPSLNRPTTQTLKRLLESSPRTVLAYLLNRYHVSDWRTATHRDDSWFETMMHKIRVWQHLLVIDSDPDVDCVERSFRVLAHWLLELDSKCNLHTLTPAVSWFDKFFACESAESFETFANEFALLATPLIIEADRLFQIGNRMASSAYIKSWFDHPDQNQRKVEIAGRIKGRSRQELFDNYGSVAVGAMLAEDSRKAKAERAAAKAKADSRIIKGRSSRSKSAKLINKHSELLNRLFGDLTAATENQTPLAPTPKPVRTIGLPMFVKKD